MKNAFKPPKNLYFFRFEFLDFLERQSRVSSTSTLSLDQFSKEPEINFQEIEPTPAELNKTENNLEPVAGELSNTDKSRTLTPGMDPNSMKAYSCAMAWKDRSKLSLKRAKSEGRRRSKVWTKSMNSAITGHLMSEQRKIFFFNYRLMILRKSFLLNILSKNFDRLLEIFFPHTSIKW